MYKTQTSPSQKQQCIFRAASPKSSSSDALRKRENGVFQSATLICLVWKKKKEKFLPVKYYLFFFFLSFFWWWWWDREWQKKERWGKTERGWCWHANICRSIHHRQTTFPLLHFFFNRPRLHFLCFSEKLCSCVVENTTFILWTLNVWLFWGKSLVKNSRFIFLGFFFSRTGNSLGGNFVKDGGSRETLSLNIVYVITSDNIIGARMVRWINTPVCLGSILG